MPGVLSSGGWELVVFFRARLPLGFAEASRGWAAGVGQRTRNGLGVEWPFWRDLAGCVGGCLSLAGRPWVWNLEEEVVWGPPSKFFRGPGNDH